MEHGASLSVRCQCELLRVNRSSGYYEKVGPDTEELELMRGMDELQLKHPFCGSSRIARELRGQGLQANRKRIQRLMRAMGLEAIGPKPKTSRPEPEHAI